jgi:hypothetical protein
MSSGVSAAALLPRFGRAWNITIENADGLVISFGTTPPPGNVFLPEPLHITFNSYQTIQQGFWYCDIEIFNLNSPTTQELLLQGMTVTLDAGYQTQPYGTIFKGTLLQPLWTRNGNTDKLTLHCICGLIESSNNFIGQTIAGGITQRQLVAQMAAACHFPLDASNTDDLSSGVDPRASTFFGQPSDFLQEIADGNNANLWFTNMALNIRALREQTTVPTISYGPGTGLIGSPQQTQDGVQIRVLLDPRLTLLTQVKLDEGVIIEQLPRNIPSYPTILDANGLYIVGAVKHFGDSRANTWYSDITGFVNAGSLLSLQTQF